MKYKYSRKEIADKWETTIKYSGNDLIRDLLAQKEYRKECKHKLGDKEEHDNLGTYHIAGDTCVKCGKHIMDWDNPTPSPLEIEEIEEITAIKSIGDCLSDYSGRDFRGKINALISNQKKLYQYIKDKKL